MLQSIILSMVERRLSKLDLPIDLEMADGRALKQSAGARVKIIARSLDALKKLAEPTMGSLAEAYVKQEIDLVGSTRDLVALAERFCEADEAVMTGTEGVYARHQHTREADRASISSHYDVSNDFYGLWLDRNRVYSCGYFRTENDTLDEAQEQKLEHICRKLVLKPGERFLDIGCGWGGLVMWAAQHHGVQATGVTISQNQYDYIQGELARRGLKDRVQVHLMDYRDVSEATPFDKIASVGMFEHVGRSNMPEYFSKISRLLKPGGLVLNHGITSTNLTREGLGSDISEFVDKYVFPNGELIHIAHVLEFMAGANIEIRDVESLRPHYARTLWHWVDNLEQHEAAARAMIGEDKYRVWRIYMAGSGYGFEHNWMSLHQVLGAKPLPDGTLPYPLTRAHLYS